jgi:hypothetical protein
VPGQSLAKVFGKLLIDHKVAEAKRTIERLTNDRASYSISEAEFNTLGYDFMGSNQLPEALATFKTNTQLFPKVGILMTVMAKPLKKTGKKKKPSRCTENR